MSDRYRVFNTPAFGRSTKRAAGVRIEHFRAEDEEMPDEERPVMFGYFARFDAWNEINSMVEGNFMERVAPGAFDDSLRDFTPKPIFDHGMDPSVGMKPIGVTRSIDTDDDFGPHYEADLFDSVPELVLDGLRAGAYGASYRFSVEDEEVNDDPGESDHNPKGIPEVTILRATVKEYGPTAFGADPLATAGIRSATDRFITPAADGRETVGRVVQASPAALRAAAERAAILRAHDLRRMQ